MGVTGRADAKSPPGLSFATLFVISLIGGAIGIKTIERMA